MGFERCHPAVNFFCFGAVLAATAVFRSPVFLAISLFAAFAYSLCRAGSKALAFDLCTLPLAALFGLYYTSYNHFGITVLRHNFVGNNMTLEALVYGCVLGLTLACLCIWMICVYSVFSTDKVVYLFGRVSPRLSLFLAILLRMVPRIRREAIRIHTARQALGLGIRQGSLWQRLRNAVRIFSMLITWTVEALATASDSMVSRGSNLRGRTAFSIYRFDNRDRLLVIFLFFCITLTAMASILGISHMSYDPTLRWEPLGSLGVACCIGYAGLCLLPLGLELWTGYCFRRSRRKL